MPDSKLLKGNDGQLRCSWFGGLDDYQAYHDDEWGHPTADDRVLFQKICLEGFQSGLSWLTILRKRENFRAAFADFDFEEVARFTDEDIERLAQDKGIIRHRGKIRSTINNAQRACDLVDKEGSLARYIWSYEPENHDHRLMQTTSPESIALSKDLKKRGWSFVGPTTMYAFIQSMGLINDHMEGCIYHAVIEEKRAAFKRP